MKAGWELKHIGDLCEVIAGQSPDGRSYNADGQGVPFYQGKKDFGEKFLEAPTTWTTQATKIARAGDILMSVRAPVGPVNFADGAVCIGRGLAAIRSPGELSRDFLFYQLLHLQPQIAGKEGAVFASISKSEIEALPIAVTPLPEQQRIVGILDEAFAAIATARANAERNVQNARALFESHLNAVFTQRGEGWVERRLEEVFKLGSSKRVLETEWTRSGVPFYGGREVVQLAQTGATQAAACIPEERYQEIASVYGVPIEGDILMTARGTIGVGYVVRRDDRFYYKDGNIICLHPREPTEARFVLYAFRSRAVRDQLAYLTGATVTHLPIERASSLVVTFPSFPAQQRVVKGLQEVESETQRLVALYQRKLLALDELKQSLLHQAFSGEL